MVNKSKIRTKHYNIINRNKLKILSISIDKKYLAYSLVSIYLLCDVINFF